MLNQDGFASERWPMDFILVSNLHKGKVIFSIDVQEPYHGIPWYLGALVDWQRYCDVVITFILMNEMPLKVNEWSTENIV